MKDLRIVVDRLDSYRRDTLQSTRHLAVATQRDDSSPNQLNNFVGTYRAANGSSFSIENRNGKLFRVVANGAPRELKAESPSKLFYDDESDRQIEFVFDKHGVKVRFISQGLVTELKKVQ